MSVLTLAVSVPSGVPVGVIVLGLASLGLWPWWNAAPWLALVVALFGVFLDVGIRTGVPKGVLAFALLFASSYFSTITPQGGSQNVIFVGSGYLTQGELYRLGLITTAFSLLVFLVVGTPWLLLVASVVFSFGPTASGRLGGARTARAPSVRGCCHGRWSSDQHH